MDFWLKPASEVWLLLHAVPREFPGWLWVCQRQEEQS
jgi:hypothetical protein